MGNLSLDRTQQIADKVLESLGLGAVVQIKVASNPAAIGVFPPTGVVATGLARDGEIYLFADNMGDDLTAFKTVFHELFHLGLSKSPSLGQYMQRQAANSRPTGKWLPAAQTLVTRSVTSST